MRLTHLAMTAAVAGAMATPVALAATASAAAAGSGSAYGISASGLVNIPPTPAVSSMAQEPTSKSLIELPANPLISARVLNATASAGHARASVADVRVAKIGLSAHLITANCENGTGVSRLARVVLGGKVLQVSPKPNTSISVNLDKVGLAEVTLNKQVRGPGGGLTVTAVEVKLVSGKLQTISISSASCKGGGETEEPPTTPGSPNPSPSPTTSTPAGEAPAPTPVTGDLPVTG